MGWKIAILQIHFLMIWMFILSVGFFGIYRKDSKTAVLLLLMFSGIQLANSLGRTSGG